MSHAPAFVVVALIALTTVPAADAADPQPPRACRQALDTRLPRWQLSPPPDDLAAYARQNKLTTNLIQADFDSNGSRDTALLVIVPGSGNPNMRQYVAVCLTEGSRTRLQLIREPYCGDGISVARRGTRVVDHQTEQPVTYWANGVSTYCFEKASGTYLYRDGQFVLVVDSD